MCSHCQNIREERRYAYDTDVDIKPVMFSDSPYNCNQQQTVLDSGLNLCDDDSECELDQNANRSPVNRQEKRLFHHQASTSVDPVPSFDIDLLLQQVAADEGASNHQAEKALSLPSGDHQQPSNAHATGRSAVSGSDDDMLDSTDDIPPLPVRDREAIDRATDSLLRMAIAADESINVRGERVADIPLLDPLNRYAPPVAARVRDFVNNLIGSTRGYLYVRATEPTISLVGCALALATFLAHMAYERRHGYSAAGAVG